VIFLTTFTWNFSKSKRYSTGWHDFASIFS